MFILCIFKYCILVKSSKEFNDSNCLFQSSYIPTLMYQGGRWDLQECFYYQLFLGHLDNWPLKRFKLWNRRGLCWKRNKKLWAKSQESTHTYKKFICLTFCYFIDWLTLFYWRGEGVTISLHTEFQLSRLYGSRTAILRLNPILGEGGSGYPIFWLIFLLVGFKEACMPNFSFLGGLEVVVIWL